MPFTQREIDAAFDLACRFHGVDPSDLGVRPPLLGSDIPAKARAEDVIAAMQRALRGAESKRPPSRGLSKCFRLIERFNALSKRVRWRG